MQERKKKKEKRAHDLTVAFLTEFASLDGIRGETRQYFFQLQQALLALSGKRGRNRPRKRGGGESSGMANAIDFNCRRRRQWFESFPFFLSLSLSRRLSIYHTAVRSARRLAPPFFCSAKRERKSEKRERKRGKEERKKK